jgi:hypothetical protein
MLALVEQWRTEGSSRLDRNNTGKITAPGAAIMDTAWPKIANAVMAEGFPTMRWTNRPTFQQAISFAGHS